MEDVTTDEQRAEILRLMTDTEAAKAMGVSRQRAHQIRIKLGVPRPYNMRARIVELATTKGLPAKVIAIHLGEPLNRVKRVFQEEGLAKPNLAPCGTVTAYKRHKRRGEEVDQACQDANNEFHRSRRGK